MTASRAVGWFSHPLPQNRRQPNASFLGCDQPRVEKTGDCPPFSRSMSAVDPGERAILLDLSEPDERTVETLRRVEGDLVLLGAGGKIGHGLALMARRGFEAAGRRNRVVAVSRFTDPGARRALEEDGIAALACDLGEAGALAGAGDPSDVIYLAGRKFGGSGGGEAQTWFQNAYLPGVVAQRFPGSRWAV